MKPWQKNFHRQLLQALLPKKIVTPRVTQKKSKNREKNQEKVAQNSPKKVENSSLEPGENFSHRVNCTLSKNEYKTLKKVSEKQKIPATKLLKILAFSFLENRKFFSPNQEKITRCLVLEIRKIGTNINQIAKHANTFQKIGFSDLKHTHKRLDELEKLLREAIEFYRKQ